MTEETTEATQQSGKLVYMEVVSMPFTSLICLMISVLAGYYSIYFNFIMYINTFHCCSFEKISWVFMPLYYFTLSNFRGENKLLGFPLKNSSGKIFVYLSVKNVFYLSSNSILLLFPSVKNLRYFYICLSGLTYIP